MMDFFFKGMQLYCTGLRSTARMFARLTSLSKSLAGKTEGESFGFGRTEHVSMKEGRISL